jgi:Protein of unknown function (DUF998)
MCVSGGGIRGPPEAERLARYSRCHEEMRNVPAQLLTEGKAALPAPSPPTQISTPRADPSEVTKQGLSKLNVLLLSCGIVAPLLYVATDVFLAIRWEGYSYRDQTISELNAIGAPTRTLSIILGIAGYAFLVAFGVGVWRSAAANRRLRVAAGGLIALGVLAWFGVPFMSMHVREAEETLTDTLHVAQLAIAGPLLLVIIGFGAAAFGWRFRLYSAATVLLTLAFGAWSGTYGADIANDLETPWAGVIERMSVYAYQLWFVVFATALLALAYDRRPAVAPMQRPFEGGR